jgi:hypothetical protein
MIATANPPRGAPRRAVSVVEFLVVFVIFTIGVLTLYSMFGSTSEEAFRSKWAYLSAHAAREELEALRTLNLFGKNGSTEYTGHDWRALGGSMLTDLEDGTAGGATEYQYPPGYERIETKVEIDASGGDRFRIVTLYVRYQKKGSSVYGLQSKSGNPLAIGTYRTVITNREFR